MWRNVAPALVAPCLSALVGCGQVDVRQENDRLASLTSGLSGLSGLEAGFPQSAEAVEPAEVAVQLAGGPNGWTEENAVRAALLLHPTVRAELAHVGASKADLVQAGLLPNPGLTGNVVFASAAPVLFTFDFAQQLLLLGQIPIRQAAARAALERTLLQSADAILADLAAVRRTWHELAAALELIELLQKTEAIFGRSLKATQDRREAGAATGIDVNLAESQVLLVQAEIAAAEGRLDSLRAIFAARVGFAEWDEGWTLAAAPAESAPPPTRAEAIASAIRNRPDLQIADARIREAEAGLRQAHLAVFPILSAGFTTMRQPPVYYGPNFGLAEIPIFDQGLAKIARAEFVLAEAKRMRESAELAARRDVSSALAELAASHRQVVLLRERLVPLAERNLALAEQAFKGGGANVLTVLVSQQSFAEAQRRLLTAVRDYRVQSAELDRAAGRWMTFPPSKELRKERP